MLKGVFFEVVYIQVQSQSRPANRPKIQNTTTRGFTLRVKIMPVFMN